MKKKITQILYPGLGGHSSVAFSIIEGDKKGEFCHSLIGYGIENPSPNFIAKAEKMTIHFNSVLKKIGFDFYSYFSIYKLLKVERPNLIIMHSNSLIFIVWWYGLWNKVNWSAVEHQPNYAKTLVDWISSFFILILSPHVVLLTEEYRQELKQKFGLLTSTKDISIISNGIMISSFTKKEQLSNDVIVFSMASRMNTMRDHNTLIKAFSEISKLFKANLYIAGVGDTLITSQQLVKNLSLENTVIFTGNLNEEDLIGLLHKTDIYIHSSLSETLSTSLLQVMACEVPIIATNIPGINNLLNHKVDALLFEPKCTSSLIERIIELVNNPLLADKLKKNAFKKVKDNYDCEVMFKKYANFIK